MINLILKSGGLAVALAASALLSPPSMAQENFRADRVDSNIGLNGNTSGSFVRHQTVRSHFGAHRINVVGNRGNAHKRQKVQLNAYGQTMQEVKFLADKAINACACQLDIDAHRYGFKGGSFHLTPYYEQTGPNRFIVKGTAKLFDGYDYSRQSYDCVVRQGAIKQVSNLHAATHRGRIQRHRGKDYSALKITFGNLW